MDQKACQCHFFVTNRNHESTQGKRLLISTFSTRTNSGRLWSRGRAPAEPGRDDAAFVNVAGAYAHGRAEIERRRGSVNPALGALRPASPRPDVPLGRRSEERRVGKECRSRRSPVI